MNPDQSRTIDPVRRILLEIEDAVRDHALEVLRYEEGYMMYDIK